MLDKDETATIREVTALVRCVRPQWHDGRVDMVGRLYEMRLPWPRDNTVLHMIDILVVTDEGALIAAPRYVREFADQRAAKAHLYRQVDHIVWSGLTIEQQRETEALMAERAGGAA